MAPKKKVEPSKTTTPAVSSSITNNSKPSSSNTTTSNNNNGKETKNVPAATKSSSATPIQQQSEKVSKVNVEKTSSNNNSKTTTINESNKKNNSTAKSSTNNSSNVANTNKPVVPTATVNLNPPPVVSNDSSSSKKKKKQQSTDTTNTTTSVAAVTATSTTTAQSKKNNVTTNSVTTKNPTSLTDSNKNTTTVASNSLNNENAMTTSKKKKKKSALSEESQSVVNEKESTKNNLSPNSVTPSPTSVSNDIATTAQPSTIVKSKPAHDPGKDDNSLSAWLCRAYFAIGLLIAWNLCFIIVLPMYICHLLFGFDKNKSLMGWIFRYANRCVVETNPFWNIKTFYANGSTKNRLPKKQKKVIFICNHQSGMDPFILISALPIEAKWVAKHIIFKIPIAGWLMTMIGDVPIVFTSKKAENTTTDKGSVTRALDTLRNYLNNDCAVFFFPEGRRSENPDEFLEFRKGAFVMALQTGADIIPIAISGSHTIWELKHKLPRPGRCAMVVGDPISVKGMTLENDVDNLLQKSRKAVEDLYQIAKKKAKSLK